jgi:hypothetical protein
VSALEFVNNGLKSQPFQHTPRVRCTVESQEPSAVMTALLRR